MPKIFQRTVLCLLLGGVVIPVKAQFDYLQVEDTSKVKIEAGINIAPFIQGLIGNNFSDPLRLSAMVNIYKVKTRILRLGVQYLKSGEQYYTGFGYYTNDSYINDNYLVVSQTDSTQIRRISAQAPKHKLQISCGGAYTWGKRKLRQFAGADILFGHYTESRHTTDHAFRYDTTFVGSSQSGGWWVPDNNIPRSMVSESFGHMFYAGLSPFYGIRLTFGKRFVMTAQTGPDISLAFGKIDYDDYLAGTSGSYSLQSFEFNMYSLVSDLSLYYRF